MNDRTKYFRVRVEEGLHTQATESAEARGMSLADLVREAVRTFCAPDVPTQEAPPSEMLDELRTQLRTKDAQIAHLHTQLEQFHQRLETEQASRQQQNAIIMQQTQQLERAQLQLEDLRTPRTVWQRMKSAFKPGA